MNEALLGQSASLAVVSFIALTWMEDRFLRSGTSFAADSQILFFLLEGRVQVVFTHHYDVASADVFVRRARPLVHRFESGAAGFVQVARLVTSLVGIVRLQGYTTLAQLGEQVRAVLARVFARSHVGVFD